MESSDESEIAAIQESGAVIRCNLITNRSRTGSKGSGARSRAGRLRKPAARLGGAVPPHGDHLADILQRLLGGVAVRHAPRKIRNRREIAAAMLRPEGLKNDMVSESIHHYAH